MNYPSQQPQDFWYLSMDYSATYTHHEEGIIKFLYYYFVQTPFCCSQTLLTSTTIFCHYSSFYILPPITVDLQTREFNPGPLDRTRSVLKLKLYQSSQPLSQRLDVEVKQPEHSRNQCRDSSVRR